MELFYHERHVQYIKRVANDVESFEYLVTQYLRMSGVYWGMTAIRILGEDFDKVLDPTSIVEWVMGCQDPSNGGFGGNTDHDAHMLYTLSALQILALTHQLHRIDKIKVATYIASLQNPDGSFKGDEWGEVDTRFSYCALSSLSILGLLHEHYINVDKAVDFVVSCQNFDGGFGAVPGAESHAGQIFCCIGALSIAHAMDKVDADLLGWWLSERQCDSGGLNGRPEKQADVCYSWWILSCLSILGRISWIDGKKLEGFILQCQDSEDGGISDRPGNMADIFHTFFGISGLSLLGFLHPNDGNLTSETEHIDTIKNNNSSIIDSNDIHYHHQYIRINPTYALPEDIVDKYNLKYQKLPSV